MTEVKTVEVVEIAEIVEAVRTGNDFDDSPKSKKACDVSKGTKSQALFFRGTTLLGPSPQTVFSPERETDPAYFLITVKRHRYRLSFTIHSMIIECHVGSA